MNELQYNECYLASHGYKCEVRVMATYRGSIYLNKIVTAEKNGQLGFVLLPAKEDVQHLLRIKGLEDRLPMAAKIVDVIEDKIFVIERVSGILLWENEDNLPAIDEIKRALGLLVASLQQVGLVHGDIRPWNIFYDANRKQFKVIDWGFSFFLENGPSDKTKGHLDARGHKPPYQDVDQIDASKTIQVIEGSLSYEDAWHHPSGEMFWRPKWGKLKN
jgi:hypothetical protein